MRAEHGTGAVAVSRRYFEAWNRRDGDAVTSMFADGGSYTDPTTQGPIAGAPLAAKVAALAQAFPDLAFDIVSVHQPAPELVIAEWRMRGTNTGPFQGLPPTEKNVSLAGVDFITVAGDKVRTVTGYFDSQSVPLQLGLQVLIQPDRLGPFSFGTSAAAQTGSKVKPGAFSITQIINGDDDEMQDTRTMAREIAKEIMAMDGAIGVMTARLGRRGVTVSAWENAEQPKQLMAGGTHSEAVRKFFGRYKSGSAYTSVWIPARINALWMICPSCHKTSDYEKAAGRCPCGTKLPDPDPYW